MTLSRAGVTFWPLVVAVCILCRCGPTGSKWATQSANERLAEERHGNRPARAVPAQPGNSSKRPVAGSSALGATAPKAAEPTRTAATTSTSSRPSISIEGPDTPSRARGTWLGRFRNTFYNFPLESDYSGKATTVYDRQCKPLASVPLEFHDRLCVQGSGRLSRGQTVSFARRNCRCARVCPRTDQQICFEGLSPKRFPWGRGAAGTAIVPLRTIAVDSKVIALGTVVYVPQFVGKPAALNGTGSHNGCFLAADRGIAIRGKHIDVFAGSEEMTRHLNQIVPSNQGVDVYVDSPRCTLDSLSEANDSTPAPDGPG